MTKTLELIADECSKEKISEFEDIAMKHKWKRQKRKCKETNDLWGKCQII